MNGNKGKTIPILGLAQNYRDAFLIFKAFKIQLTELGKVKGALQLGICLSKVLSGEKGKEIEKYFGIKGPVVSDAIKRMKGRLDKESQPKKRIELLNGRIVPEL